MKKNNENNANTPENGEKLHISQNIFETMRENKKKEAAEELKKQAELEQKLAERRKKSEEARAKRLEEERLELIRLKQGIIEESDSIKEETEEEVKMTVWQKIVSFFYLNKWWLTIAVIFGTIACILLHSFLSRPNPDVILLVIGENYKLSQESQLEEYIESLIEDINGNGKIEASVHYIPYTGDDKRDYASSATSMLSAELQSDNGAIVIGNKLAAEMLSDGVFVDLSAIYPDNELIKGDKLMLKDSALAEKIGVDESVITDEWFIAIREPHKLMHTSEKRMQKLYEKDFPVFDAIVKDISE